MTHGIQIDVPGYRAPRQVCQLARWLAERRLPSALAANRRFWPPFCHLPDGFAFDPEDHIGARVLTSGLYEAQEIQAAAHLAKVTNATRGLFVDIGAHMGVYTCTLGRQFQGVVAFEPNPRIFLLLKHNTYHLPQVDCRPMALAQGRAVAKLLSEPGNSGHAWLEQFTSTDGARVDGATVDVDSLDAQLADRAAPIGFIKIDVEGAETNVLRGARRTLQKDRPLVSFEALGGSQFMSHESPFDILRREGYRVMRPRHRSPSDVRALNFLHRVFVAPRLVLEELMAPPLSTHRQLFAIPEEVWPEVVNSRADGRLD